MKTSNICLGCKNLFDYFNHKGENDQLSGKGLTQKLLILLLLLGGQRMNTFFTLDIMTIADIGVTCSPNHVLIHSKPGKKLDSFHNRAYHNKRLCVLDCLKEYMKFRSTKVQTDTKALFITWQTF